MKRPQKYNHFIYSIVAMAAVTLLFSACESPSEVVLSPFEEEKAYFEFVMTNDDFFTSEEEILNDPEYNIGKITTGGSIQPRHSLRRVKNIDRTYAYDFVDDTTVIVTMTRTMEIRLFINGLVPPLHGITWRDTMITKEFTEVATRKARFIKVSNTGTVEDDWKLVSISLVDGGTPIRGFDIEYVKLDFKGDRVYEFEDPLNTFLRIGLGTRQVPVVNLANFRNDGYRIEVVIRSTNENPETLFLRHGGVMGGHIGGISGYMRRMTMETPRELEKPGDEIYIRKYVFEWNQFIDVESPVRSGEQIRKGRFSTMVEALSYDTIHDIEAPAQTHYWGVPFIIE